MKILRPGLAAAFVLCAAVSHAASSDGPARQALSGGDQRFIEMPTASTGARFFVNGGAQSIAFDSSGARMSVRGSLAKSASSTSLRFDFAAANPVVPQGADASDVRYHWLVGPRDTWATDLRAFGSINYRGVWSGIDATWSGDRSGLKYHFTVAPGASPKSIAFTVSGAQDARIAADGALEWKLNDAWQRDERPVAWQGKGGQNVAVKAAYRLEKLDASSWHLAFDLGDYDKSRELTLDPAWSSVSGLVGGNASDQVFAVKRDAGGNTFACGATASSNLPVTPTYTGFPGDPDNAFIVKFNNAGVPQFVTYLGGNGFDTCNGLALDGGGNIYVAGGTTSTNLALTGSLDTLFKRTKSTSDRDAFVYKFGPDGKTVAYSGVIGGTLDDQANAIAVDASNRVYITGFTTCTATTSPGCNAGFPVKTGPSTTHGGDASGTFGQDAFVVRILADGTTLDYSGFIGGNGAVEAGRGIAVTAAGEAIVVGETDSTAGLPSSTGFRTAAGNGDGDGFVAKVAANGSGFSFFNVLLGAAGANSGADRALAVAIDSDNAIVVVGETDSDSFPASNGGTRQGVGAQNSLSGNMDGFLLRIAADGLSVLTATYIGGDHFDSAEAVAVDGLGGIYLTGSTSAGISFPVVLTAGLSFTRFGAQDGFIAKVLQGSPSSFNYSGFVGSNATTAASTNNDAMHAIDVNGGILSVGGATGADASSITGATSGALGSASSPNGVVLRINTLANTFVVVSGTPQSQAVNTNFTAPLVVKVADNDGNALANYPVVFTAPGSAASATLTPGSGSTVFTNAAGTAQVTARANGGVGTYNVTASAVNFTPVTFALTNQFVASVTVTAPQSTITQGTSITFTATVTGSSPTGTVDFKNGATFICTAVALTGTTATCTTSTLAPATYSITAVYSGDAFNIGATSPPFALVVNRNAQVITFTQPADKVFGAAPFDLVATGGASGNPVTFSTTTTTVCTLSGTNNKTVTIVGAGNCTVTADQAGNVNYDPAPPVSRTFAVTQATQVINFTQPPDKVFGDPSFNLAATGGASGNPVTFSSSTPIVCTVSGTNNMTVIIGGAGTCTVTANQAGNANYSAAVAVTLSFNVAKASQLIDFPQPPDKVFGAAPFNLVAAGGGSGNPVTFSTTTTTVCTLSGINNVTVTIVGAGSCTITANQAGTVNFDPAPSVPRTFNVAKAAQLIDFPQPGDRVFGAAAFNLAATGGASGNPVTFSTTTTTVCTLSGTNNFTVTIVGAGTCTITANQAGNANYNAAAPVTQSFNVAKATQAITFTPPAAKNFGDAPFTLTATGGASGNPVTFSSTTASVCTLSGLNNSTVTIVGVGNCVVTASQLGNGNYSDATPVTGTIVVSAVAPGAPTIGAATPGPASATIAFTAPTFTGGSPITGYTVSCTPGPVTQGGTASPITLNGLSNIQYTCSVRASNAVGPGPASGTVTVTPSPANFTLSVATNGTGTGSVASNPPGINCPGTCSAPFANAAVVTLTPTAAAGSLFTSWSGACTGSAACQVTMDAAKSVTATFTLSTSPNPFTFVDVTNVQPNTVVTSNAVTMAGLGGAAAISVTGGSYSIGCTSAFTTAAGTINNGQTVCVRHTTALALLATTNTTLTVGATSDTFTSTTSATLDPALDADNDGIPNGVEPAEGRNPLVKDNDVFGVNRLYVMQQYRDFLGREGDAGGINYSVNLLATGAAVRANIAENFMRAGEYQNVAGPIIRLYFGALLRAPDFGGYQFQLARMRSGVVIDDIADGFGNSPEFTTRYGALTNSQFVSQVYLNVLGRAGTQAEINYHLARLAGGLSRGRFMLGFTESGEFIAATRSETIVTMLFTAMLRRTPDAGAYGYWNAQLDGGLPVTTMVSGILNSTEYHNRFLP